MQSVWADRLLLTKGYSKRKLAEYFYEFVSSRYPQANMTKAEMNHRFKNGIINIIPHHGMHRAHTLVCIERLSKEYSTNKGVVFPGELYIREPRK